MEAQTQLRVTMPYAVEDQEVLDRALDRALD